ncbi:hypothetical protein N0Y54_33410 [Nostoc punctiforme UO1]|uniref:hypothetical protein n=1 Tax=Nostoc punctiforme TaxID=272131 RepID=UPI0030A96110
MLRLVLTNIKQEALIPKVTQQISFLSISTPQMSCLQPFQDSTLRITKASVGHKAIASFLTSFLGKLANTKVRSATKIYNMSHFAQTLADTPKDTAFFDFSP